MRLGGFVTLTHGDGRRRGFPASYDVAGPAKSENNDNFLENPDGFGSSPTPFFVFGDSNGLSPLLQLTRLTDLPAAEDEATVNAAAVILLQTLTHLIGSELEWIFSRIRFSCKLQATKFNAFTDGALRSKQNQRVFAIPEAKK
ncbi:hypothetical protein N7535_003365 [Penicillium sp. DV-2018c]|nr:hypothetical protein N7535_003365 [Penicillium sp. DV-2018c]